MRDVFSVSKLVWSFLVPSHFLLLSVCVCIVALKTRFARQAYALLVVSIVFLCLIAFSPLAYWVLKPLEDRFPVPQIEGSVDGIIILGGAVGLSRDQVKLSAQGARMSSGVALARRYPHAKLVFTGGDGALLSTGERWTEADAARQFFDDVGMEEAGKNQGRIIYENKSRNTYENALFSFQRVKPQPIERWVLVTSAFHMPRAVGVFRRIGWEVIPYPVDFETDDTTQRLRLTRDASGTLKRFDVTLKEWVGLFAYWLNGYTSEIYPAANQ
jgi:uncharacterized SAM-binding protein YcdF (DUF218 family)